MSERYVSCAVEMNPESYAEFKVELDYIKRPHGDRAEAYYGYYLVILDEKLELLSPVEFHMDWKFKNVATTNRNEMRTIIAR